MGRKEEPVENMNTTLGGKAQMKNRVEHATQPTWSMSSKCLADMFFIADTSPENFRIVSRPKLGMRRNLQCTLGKC